jgi:dipeptidyl aminopeptidase/acylaminoacyl peptidase
MLYCIGVSFTLMIVSQFSFSGLARDLKLPISIKDIVSYTRIRNICLSPDGEWVAYLAIRPQIVNNKYYSTLLLQRAEPDLGVVKLAEFYTTADQTFDKDTHALNHFGGQFLWSADSRKLIYTNRAGDKVQLWLYYLDSHNSVKVAGDFPNAEIVEWDDNNTVIKFKVVSEISDTGPKTELTDPALRITDDTNFWAAPWYNSVSSKETTHVFKYNTLSRELVEVKGQSEEGDDRYVKYEDGKWSTKPDETKYAIEPILSPDKKKAVFQGLGLYNRQDIKKAYRDFFVGVRTVGDNSPPKEYYHTPHYVYQLKWKGDGKEVYALLLDPEYTAVLAITVENGVVRELLRTEHSLSDPSWNTDGTAFVAVKQSSLMPDELVKIDLANRKIKVLASPNADFAEKELPEVKFMRVNNPLGGGIFGRLVLPNGYIKGNRYPLIFTTYRTGAGFLEGAVGDEFPILPFAAAGFAVFVMDTGISNMLSDSGDLEFTSMRLRRPLDAMMTVRRQLATEGIIDPERCAITGLSYGSDITAYSVVNTDIFKAASLSSSGLDPIAHNLNSVNREKTLAKSGHPYPDSVGLEQWKKLSIALNAAKIVTPILIQSSDSEAMFSLETFKALKHYGVPVDWYVYRDEGHVKSQSLNKYYVYRRNLDWMKFWLKDEVTSDPDRQDQYSRWRTMKELFHKKKETARKDH